MKLDVDARSRKVVADLAEVRREMLAGALAVGLGSLSVMVWQPPLALVAVGLLPLAALVVALGAARVGRARAAERSFLRAVGATEGYAATVSCIEGVCFGASAAVIGLVVGSILALFVGGTPGLGWDIVWLVMTTAVAAVSASVTAQMGLEPAWPASL